MQGGPESPETPVGFGGGSEAGLTPPLPNTDPLEDLTPHTVDKNTNVESYSGTR